MIGIKMIANIATGPTQNPIWLWGVLQLLMRLGSTLYSGIGITCSTIMS